MERLLAFGHSRLRTNLMRRPLIEAAGPAGTRSVAAMSFANMHVRYLLRELGVDGDLPLLATAILAPARVWSCWSSRSNGSGSPSSGSRRAGTTWCGGSWARVDGRAA